MPESLQKTVIALVFLGEIVIFVLVPLLIELLPCRRKEGKS
jgi:hypothetical protein